MTLAELNHQLAHLEERVHKNSVKILALVNKLRNIRQSRMALEQALTDLRHDKPLGDIANQLVKEQDQINNDNLAHIKQDLQIIRQSEIDNSKESAPDESGNN